MPLRGDHHVRLVQDKDPDLLDVKEAELERPVQHLSRRPDYNMVADLAPSGDLLSLDRVPQRDLRRELRHLGSHLAGLQCKLVRGGQAEDLEDKTGSKQKDNAAIYRLDILFNLMCNALVDGF